MGMFVDFIVRKYSHQQMDINFGRFKMLAFQTMADDERRDDVNNETSSFKRSSMTFCMCLGLYDRNQHCIEHSNCKNCTKHVVPSFVRPNHFDAYVVKCFALV